jgi:hypothetical protein
MKPRKEVKEVKHQKETISVVQTSPQPSPVVDRIESNDLPSKENNSSLQNCPSVLPNFLVD